MPGVLTGVAIRCKHCAIQWRTVERKTIRLRPLGFELIGSE